MQVKIKSVTRSIFLIGAFFLFANLTKPDIAKEDLPSDLKDVPYGTNIDTIGMQEPLTMDIYFPAHAATGQKFPLVLMIHGGGFIGGNKANMGKACQQFADSGFVAATINYRMGWSDRDPDDKGFPQFNTQAAAAYRALQDAAAAMRFLVSKAKEYAIDTAKIFVGGGSAGAITALQLAYATEAYFKRQSPAFVQALGGLSVTNNLTNRYSIKGICSMWGALPDSSLITKSTAVPTIFFHGTADRVVPVDAGAGVSKAYRLFGSLCLYRQMQKLHVPAVVHLAQGEGHGPQTFRKADFTMNNTICFFRSVLMKQYNDGIYYGLDNSCKQ